MTDDWRTAEMPSRRSVNILTQDECHMHLEHAVVGYVRSGAVVLHQTGTEALMLYPGKRLNNVLHAVLSIFTFGMWLPVWALVAIYCAFNGDKQFTVSVDEYGATFSDLRANKPSVAKTWMVIGGILLVLIILVSI